jgi:hypothetical protein
MKEGTVPVPLDYPGAERDIDVVPFREISHSGGLKVVRVKSRECSGFF